MAQVLIIDDAAIAVLNGLREHAEANPISLDEMAAMLKGEAPYIGERPHYCVELPTGISIALSIEQHPNQRYRHTSISVRGRLPSPPLVEELIRHLGFTNSLGCCLLYTEQNDSAISVLEPASGEIMPHGAWLASPN